MTSVLRASRAIMLAVAVSALGLGIKAQAQPISYYHVENTLYKSDIPVPDAVFGHGLGERAVRHAEMVSYLRTLAEASDRMTVETIGYSHEGRPILFFVVSSPENLSRIEDIRATHLARLSGAANAPTASADDPVVVWLNYGVHGAESSSMDAAVPLLYHLAAGQSDALEKKLNDAVMLITAVYNPDGHARRIDHVERFGGRMPVTDPFHVQHQMWITARVNHYWFDLNRQWLLQTQPESKAWLSKWHHWKPNVTADYHEMGSNRTYYFHPGTPARRNPLIPDESRRLMGEIANFHARWLDSEDKLYYSEEGFDNFYIGKGSTYPHINGSIGFLFEAGAARGGKVESENGMRTYADNIRTQFRTSLTTIDGALANRDDLLAYQRAFYQDSVRMGGQAGAWVFSVPDDAARAYHFVDVLKRHKITVHELARDVTIGGVTYEAGTSYIVPKGQAQYRMIKGIFDTVTDFEEAIFYDVSSWTLPLAYGVTYDALSARAFRPNLLGDVAAPEFPTFMPPEDAPYGYVFEWSNHYAPRALYRLLDADIRARAAFKPLEIITTEGTRQFGRGSVFVPFDGQEVDREKIAKVIAKIAAEDGFKVYGVVSGQTPLPGDLGAPQSIQSLTRPEVLLLFEDGLSYYDTGEVWHLLDYKMHMPVTLARQSALQNVDWSRYTHIIFAGGRVSLSESVEDRLKQWIRESGGTVIAAGSTALWAEETLLERVADDEAADDEKKDATVPDYEPPRRYDYEDLRLRSAEHIIGGALFTGDLDITHPLGFGYDNRAITIHRKDEHVLQRPKNPVATVVEYAQEPLLSGYASQRRVTEISGTPMAVAERVDRGSVILFADNLNFRGTYLGTTKLFMNAVFFSRLISTPNIEDEDAQ